MALPARRTAAGRLAALLVVARAAEVAADITLYSTPGSSVPQYRMTSTDALFGPALPSSGILGNLQVPIGDAFGCSTFELDADGAGGRPIVALIERSPTCSFADKVLNAQLAGAAAAIIFDSYANQPLVLMNAGEDLGIEIPSVFTFRKNGVFAAEVLAANPGGGVMVELLPSRGADGPQALWNTLRLVVYTIFCALVCLATFWGCVVLCYRGGGRQTAGGAAGAAPERRVLLSKAEVLQFPEAVCGEEDSEALRFQNSSCSVCLEDFSAGERYRLLPCRHGFHTDCILPWLTERHSTCPLCKASVVALEPPPYPDPPAPRAAHGWLQMVPVRGRGRDRGRGGDAA